MTENSKSEKAQISQMRFHTGLILWHFINRLDRKKVSRQQLRDATSSVLSINDNESITVFNDTWYSLVTILRHCEKNRFQTFGFVQRKCYRGVR
jgi:hypothetical protein